MKPVIYGFAFMAITGCTGQLLFDKPGVPPGGGSGDLTDCQVEALNKVPSSNQTHSTATYEGEQRQYTIDVNEGLRRKVLVQCMERKGYTLRR